MDLRFVEESQPLTKHCAFGRRVSALQLVRDLGYKYAVGEDSA